MTTELPDYANRPFIGLAPLMASALAGFDLAPLGSLLLERVKTEPKPETLIDIANILFLRGFPELALSIQKEALSQQQIYQPPITEQPIQLRLLMLMSAGDLMANTPLEFLLQHSDIGLSQVYVTETSSLTEVVPEHDVVFVAVAQSDANMALLNSLTDKLANWPKPVINKPEAISLLTRNQVAERLQGIPGLVTPETLRVTKHELIAVHEILTDDDYPLIIRPVDSHAGQGLAKIDNYSTLIEYLSAEKAEEFYLASFYDYKSSDGLYRKYRIVLIAGKPYLCHKAISEHWMIHYLNAGMADNADKRAEEAASMADFDQTFAVKHASALQHIADSFSLDYLGIDCAETPDGQLLVFEVDSCMIIHNLDPIDAFPYKQDAMQKVFAAFRSLLINASQQH